MSIDGTWNLTMTTPMGTQTPTLNLTTKGDVLEGTMDGAQGAAPIEEGKVDGDNASWVINVAQMNMRLNFTAKVEGDNMSGTAELGAFGSADFQGVRG